MAKTLQFRTTQRKFDLQPVESKFDLQPVDPDLADFDLQPAPEAALLNDPNDISLYQRPPQPAQAPRPEQSADVYGDFDVWAAPADSQIWKSPGADFVRGFGAGWIKQTQIPALMGKKLSPAATRAEKIGEGAGRMMEAITELVGLGAVLRGIGLLPKIIPKGALAIEKAMHTGALFGTQQVTEEVRKATAEAIYDEDFGSRGGMAVLESFALGATLSLAGSSVGKIWQRLRPTEQMKQLQILGLKKGASLHEINKAARRQAIRFHPDKVKGMRAQFEEVIAARNALRKTNAKDIIIANAKKNFKKGLMEKVGVSEDVADVAIQRLNQGESITKVDQMLSQAKFGIKPLVTAPTIPELSPEASVAGRKPEIAPITKPEVNLPETKVVNETGQPLMVYHGTKYTFKKGTFSIKELGKATEAASAKEGFFFTKDKTVAEGYAESGDTEKAEKLAKKYIPLEEKAKRTGKSEDWDAYEKAYLKYEKEALKEYQAKKLDPTRRVEAVYLDIKNPLIKDYKGESYREEKYFDVIKKAKQEGYDGVIFKNTYDNVGIADTTKTDIYVVFNESQIIQAQPPTPELTKPIEKATELTEPGEIAPKVTPTQKKTITELQAEIDSYLKQQKSPPTELLAEINAARKTQREPPKPELARRGGAEAAKGITEREDSELLKRWTELEAIDKARRKPQETKEIHQIEDELFKRHEPEKRDISEKSRKEAITKTEEEIKSYDLYRDALQSIEEQQQALPPIQYIIARTKEQIPGEIKDYIGKPGAKGYKGYLWKYLTTYDENPNATGWDEALEKAGGRPGDIGEFIERLDNVVQLTKGKEVISQQALDIAIGQGDLHSEIISAKYEMLKEGFGATDINDALNQIAKKEDIDPDMIKGYYLPVEVTEYVRTKQEILGELLQKSRTAAKKAPRGRIEEEAVKKATELAHKHKIPFFVHERAGEGSGLYSVTRNPPTKGKFTKVTPPEPGELAGKVTEESIPEKEKPTFAEPPRPEGPNVLMVAEVEKRLTEKAMLSENRKLRPGARRLAKQFIGKTDLKKMTEDELATFGQVIGKLPEPTYNNKGQRIPPSIPKTTAITKAGEFEQQYAEPTFMRIFHAPEYYAEKLGVKNLVEKAEAGKLRFSLEYQQLSNKVDGWVKQIEKLGGTKLSEKVQAYKRNQPTKAVARFREILDTYDEPPDALNPREKELFNNFRELSRWLLKRENAVREALDLEPILYRKGYVRHVAQGMAKEMMNGRYPFPQGRKFWAEEIIAKKIFNTMEMHRTMTEDLEELFSRDLGFATKSMLWTALKEIHLSQPIRYLEQQLNAKGKDTPIYKTLSPSEQAKWDKVATIPSRTRRWVKDYVNVTIKGQQSRLDQDIEAIVKKTGLNGLLNKLLAPYGRALSHKPVSNFVQEAGRAQILGVLGGPIGGRPRQIMRNKFQTMQSMALYPLYKETWRTYAPIRALRKTTPDLERMLDKSLFLKAYTGTEEWPVDIKNKIAKASLRAYQWSAVTNARQAMETAYWGMMPLFNNPKFKYYGWADPKRTYKEKPEFLYPSEEKLMLKEMEFGAAATQHNYTPIGMPEIFRHKTLTPITRLQSWWMNHYFRFTEEAMRRAFTGKPTYSKEGGPTLPWKYRLGWLRYALIAVPILNMMRYQRSYFFGAAPTGMPPFAQFAQGMYNYVVGKGADNERQWKAGKKQMIQSGKTFIPGYMSYKDFEAIWSGRKDLESLFFYKKR